MAVIGHWFAPLLLCAYFPQVSRQPYARVSRLLASTLSGCV